MVVFAVFLVAVCYVCYAVIQATSNGWLLELGEEKVAFIQEFCKAIFFGTLLTPIIAFILSKIL